MSILFINGSPNHHGNTASLAAALLKGKEYETLNLTDYTIGAYGQQLPGDGLDAVVTAMEKANRRGEELSRRRADLSWRPGYAGADRLFPPRGGIFPECDAAGAVRRAAYVFRPGRPADHRFHQRFLLHTSGKSGHAAKLSRKHHPDARKVPCSSGQFALCGLA